MPRAGIVNPDKTAHYDTYHNCICQIEGSKMISAELQIRGGIEDNSEITFLIFQ